MPATIDAAYVDRVLAYLDHLQGEALRSVRAANAITPKFTEIETAIRADGHELRLATDLQAANISKGWPNIRALPGERRTVVTTLLKWSRGCVVAAVSVDFSALTIGRQTQYPQWYIGLVPTLPTLINPTHWAISNDGYEPGGGTPEAPCDIRP